MDCFVAVVWLRLIPVPRYRFDMTVGWQDADVTHQHHHGEKKNTRPGHYEAVSRQPHWVELYTVPYRRQARRNWRAPATTRIQSAARDHIRRHKPGLRMVPTTDMGRGR